VLARHRRLADAARAGAKGLGLELFAAQPSNAVTAIKAPADVDGEKIVQLLRDRFGVWLAEGQAELKGKIFRIAHLGYMTEADVLVALASLELGLHALGHRVAFGAGVRAAEEVFARP
jgi:aspartate aminotransferase-like enzyme